MSGKRINKKIDTSSLPHNKSIINWKRSEGYSLPFVYGEHTGTIKILTWYPDGNLEIEYLGKKHMIHRRDLAQAKVGNIFDYRKHDWEYNVGQTLQNIEGTTFTIVERFYGKTAMSDHSRMYKLLCSHCNDTFDRYEDNVKNLYCDVCHNKKRKKGFNDLWTTHTDIARQLLNPEDGYTCTIGQRVFFDWKCPHCKETVPHLTPKQVLNAIDREVPCKRCSDGYSYPNKFMFNILNFLGIQFYSEKSFEWEGLGDRKYDFYIPSYNMIIEMFGEQHYKGMYNTKYETIKANDDEKKHLALKNGIDHYVIINASKSKAEFIFCNIANSELSEFWDFSEVNVNDIDLLSKKRMVDRIIDLFPEYNCDFTLISKRLQIDRATVSSLINKAIRSGYVDNEYVRKAQLENKIKQHYQSEAQPLLCEELQVAFGSCREISLYFNKENISSGSIYQSIARNGKAYNFHWKKISRQEFNEYKKVHPEMAYGDCFNNE